MLGMANTLDGHGLGENRALELTLVPESKYPKMRVVQIYLLQKLKYEN